MPSNRNQPCKCGSGLKHKKCHGDPFKRAIAAQAANTKMRKLIQEELAKKAKREYDASTIGKNNEKD